jgi:hypothetical protein
MVKSCFDTVIAAGSPATQAGSSLAGHQNVRQIEFVLGAVRWLMTHPRLL